MEIDIATKQDLEIFEKRILWHLNELSKLITHKPVSKSVNMTVSDVYKEFGYSEYTQRAARNGGSLTYEKMGLKNITYKRTDVEQWIERKTIK